MMIVELSEKSEKLEHHANKKFIKVQGHQPQIHANSRIFGEFLSSLFARTDKFSNLVSRVYAQNRKVMRRDREICILTSPILGVHHHPPLIRAFHPSQAFSLSGLCF